MTQRGHPVGHPGGHLTPDHWNVRLDLENEVKDGMKVEKSAA